MKRQFKAAAVVSTAALLAIGASFTSMAASQAKTGTWVLEADGWYCYDKNGEAYTSEWCYSYGKEYFVDEDGLLATHSWVEDDDYFYFVGSTGAKTVNDWRYITAPDDADGEEAWFWFDAKGKMATGKKVIGGKTYYFDQDGKMLTGWVEYDKDSKIAEAADAYAANVTYCGEDGARFNAKWIETHAPGVDADEVEDDDVFWYYIQADGDIQTGRAKAISGKDYLFNSEGQMLTGWVVGTDAAKVDGVLDTFDTFSDSDDYIDGADPEVALGLKAYFFCDEEDGYVKKDRWVKTWMPNVFALEDDDQEKYWYWLGKDGHVFTPDSDKEAVAITFVDGDDYAYEQEATTSSNASGFITRKQVNKVDYAFRNDGRMWTGLVDVKNASSSNANNILASTYDRYYFDASGKMATGNVMIADEDGVSYKFYFGEKSKEKYGYTEGVAVTGAVNKYLYSNGQLVTQEDAKYVVMGVEINGQFEYYIINNNGAIQTSSKEYKENGDVLISVGAPTSTAFEQGNGVLKGSIKGDFSADRNKIGFVDVKNAVVDINFITNIK